MDNDNYEQPKRNTPPLDSDGPLNQPNRSVETPPDSPLPEASPVDQSSNSTDTPIASVENNHFDEPVTAPQTTTPIPAQSSPNPEQASFGAPVPAPKKKRKGLIIGIIVAAVVAVIGAGAAVYAFWYQNPEKVVTDSIVNLIKADTIKYTGTATVSGDMKLKIELDGTSMISASDVNAKVTFPLENHDYTLEGSARFDKKGDLYVMFKNLKDFVKSYNENTEMADDSAMGAPVDTSMFDKIIAKVDNKWIKISSNDLADLSEDLSKKQKCVSDALNKFQNDKKAIEEIAKVYEKNKFITIKQDLGSKDWSLGYTIDSDTGKAKAFLKDVKNTTMYKTLHDCDPGIVIDDEQIEQAAPADDESNERVELWVNQWSHTITKFKVTSTQPDSDNKGEFVVNPIFNEKADIETPKDAITLKQLQADIQELMTSEMPTELDAASEV